MEEAWQYLSNKGIVTTAGAKAYTSHYYVKFNPRNIDEYEELHHDTTLTLSELPIESTLIQNGDYYPDLNLPDYRYVSGYRLSDMQHRVIPFAVNFSVLEAALKSSKPSNVTDAQIELLLSQY
jgi:hypothetical protein